MKWETKLQSRTFWITAVITIFLVVINLWSIIMFTISTDYIIMINYVNAFNTGAFFVIGGYLAKNTVEDALHNRQENKDVV